MRFLAGWVGEDAPGAGNELLEPGGGPSVEVAERLLDDVGSFRPTVGADRGGGEVRHPQASAHAASWRAVSRSSGSAVTSRARPASSCTQSPWPVGTAAVAAATSLRA